MRLDRRGDSEFSDIILHSNAHTQQIQDRKHFSSIHGSPAFSFVDWGDNIPLSPAQHFGFKSNALAVSEQSDNTRHPLGMKKPYRHTKIIFTVGPSSEDQERLTELIREGVDVCRINMAHASHDWTREIVKRVRDAAAEADRQIALLMDVKGPEIRTGALDEPLVLKKGDALELWVIDPPFTPDHPATTVNYPHLVKDLKSGDEILVDSGLLRFKVMVVDEAKVVCETLIGGQLGSRRHINLPGVRVSLPCLTQKDRDDARLGTELGMDFFALSFVREPEDVEVLRRLLREHGSEASIIAKIEDQQGLANLEEIITAADGIMVARGDLGIECPYEDLPIIQQRAVEACIGQHKPAIVATHMLESMTGNPVPTRAEVSDVAAAVAQRTDCLMLSGETTVGKYPVECVRVFKRVAGRLESASSADSLRPLVSDSVRAKMMRSAAVLANDVGDSCLVVFTRKGRLVRLLSSLRPLKSPIFAFTDKPLIFRKMLLLWGVEPFLIDFEEDREETVEKALRLLRSKGWANPDQWAVVVANVLRKGRGVDSIQLRKIEAELQPDPEIA